MSFARFGQFQNHLEFCHNPVMDYVEQFNFNLLILWNLNRNTYEPSFYLFPPYLIYADQLYLIIIGYLDERGQLLSILFSLTEVINSSGCFWEWELSQRMRWRAIHWLRNLSKKTTYDNVLEPLTKCLGIYDLSNFRLSDHHSEIHTVVNTAIKAQ